MFLNPIRKCSKSKDEREPIYRPRNQTLLTWLDGFGAQIKDAHHQ
jgi:hypothetical protein